jgi:succinate dehydrogenase / fumarate reductase flavoprotein subunit
MKVLVVGGGLAGLRAAIAAAEAGAEVSLVSKVHPLASHSGAATGGINVALSPEDSVAQHITDTTRAGDGLNDLDAVEKVCGEAPAEIRFLERCGVPFNRDAEGRLGLKPLAGSASSRTVFAGAQTGRALLQSLWQRATLAGVRFRSDCFLLNLVRNAEGCVGAVFLDLATGEIFGEASDAVVVATGGCGQVYAPTTNAVICTGDGTAAALRAGAALLDQEMTQFYPTCFPGTGICVTEEARAHGAILVNSTGERFMSRYSPDALEMANRDVLSRAIFSEFSQGREVYLNCSNISPGHFQNELRQFAALARQLLDVDLTRDWLPVVPGMHYHMGGIETDLCGRTRLPGLFAAGECACLSVHGANRVGGNSLLETLVMGRTAGAAAARASAAADANLTARSAAVEKKKIDVLLDQKKSVARVHGVATSLGTTMMRLVGIIRDHASLTAAQEALGSLDVKFRLVSPGDSHRVFNQSLRRYLELRNQLLLARTIIEGALHRKESRGAHFRADYPMKQETASHTRQTFDGSDIFSLGRTPVRGAVAGK